MCDDCKIDFCGPQGSWISKFIPDTVFGVYLGDCCRAHDLAWGEDRVRYKNADLAFRACIKSKFENKFLGVCVSWWYYVGVRLGSLFYNKKG